MIGKYRLKPLEVEAIQFSSEESAKEIVEWVRSNGGAIRHRPAVLGRPDYLSMVVVGGVLDVQRGDWIARDTTGNYYLYKADAFSTIYTEV